MGKKTKKTSVSSEEGTQDYSVGALSSIISQGSSSVLPFASLFTTDKKQQSEPIKSKEVLPKEEEKPIEEEDKEGEDADGEEEEAAAPSTPSLRQKVINEDTKTFQMDVEKEKRTVFVGNLSVDTKKRDLLRLFKDVGPIESIRFRGAARPDDKTLKKVAVIKKMNHESRDTFLAYIRFKIPDSAEEATRMNGVEFNGKTLRVDSSIKSSVDQKKAVFIGNLDFSLSEEELLAHFRVCGEVSNVRIVRDKSTGMGKGFGYVNFDSPDGAQNALELHNSQLKDRKIRVSRSSNRPKSIVQTKGKKANSMESRESGASFKKVKKSYEKNSFQGVNAVDGKPKKKSRNRDDKKKNIIAKKLLNNN